MSTSKGVVVVVAVIAILAGFAAGYLLHPTSSPSSSSPNTVLSIVAAGTLQPIFPGIASEVANLTPGVSAPATAELFQGSLSVMSTINSLHQPFDVAAAADYRLIPAQLEPTYASYEVIFGSTPEVLAYDPSVTALSGINATNWPDKLTASGVVLGVANQSTDPNGYNGIFVLQLEGLLQNGSLSALYDHFYTTPVGGLAEPNPTTTKVEPESQAATLLSTHAVAAFIIYRSYAVSQHLSYVTLDDRVGLGSTDPANVNYYANASTSILSGSGLALVKGAPVLFSATVPLNAPNADLGVAFVDFLASPAGDVLLAAAGFTPIFPAYTDQVPSTLPGPLAPDVVALPGPLAALLG